MIKQHVPSPWELIQVRSPQLNQLLLRHTGKEQLSVLCAQSLLCAPQNAANGTAMYLV